MKESYLSKLDTAQNKKRRFTIYLSKNLARELKIYAAKNDQPMSQVVEDALTLKIQNNKEVKR